MPNKKCTKCKELKPTTEFSRNKATKDKLRPCCKACDAIQRNKHYQSHKKESALYRKEYYEEHREEILLNAKRYTQTNKEEISTKRKIHYQSHRQEILDQSKRSHEKHKDNVIAYQKEYRKTHKEETIAYMKPYRRKYYQDNKNEINARHRAYAKTTNGKKAMRKGGAKYRALKFNAKNEDFCLNEILERDDYICQLCGKKTRPDFKNPSHPLYPNVDHIVPLSKGGEHTRKNTQCLCYRCNTQKHNTGTGDQLRMFG